MAESIAGELLRVAFYKPKTWETRLVVSVNGERIVVDGEAPVKPVDGMAVRATGAFLNDGHAVRRFKADEVNLEPPLGGFQRVRYLKRVLSFLPRSQCDRIAAYTGDLSETLVPGLSHQTALRVQQAWRSAATPNAWPRALREAGISKLEAPNIARAALDAGEDPVKLLERHPYRLERFGAAWRDVERIGQSRGVAEDDPERARAAVRHVLLEAAERGHTGLTHGETIRRTERLLGSGAERVVDRALNAGELSDLNGKLVQLPEIYEAERAIALGLNRLLRTPVPPSDLPLHIDGLSYEQASHVRSMRIKRFSMLTGGPGTGKTMALDSTLRSHDGDSTVMAPTGTAAYRASIAIGREAFTAHSALRGWVDARNRWRFIHNASNPLKGNRLLVALDEGTMLDVFTMAALFEALPADAFLEIQGDENQLPSVGPGAVLRDLLRAGLPQTRLTKSWRFGKEIGDFANEILQGNADVLDGLTGNIQYRNSGSPNAVIETVERLFADGARIEDIMVMSPMYKGANGIDVLNARMKRLLNPRACVEQSGRLPGIPIVRHHGTGRFTRDERPPEEAAWIAPGDRVITREPEYLQAVRNGEAGIVLTSGVSRDRVPYVEVLSDDGELRVFEGPDTTKLDLAWVNSIHRMQGHGKRHAIVASSEGDGSVLSIEALYTGLTRAEQTLSIVGPKAHLADVITRKRHEPRMTGLLEHVRALNLERVGVAAL